MANTLINTTLVWKKIHAHFRQNTNFVPNVRNEYSGQFGQAGKKIGDTMLIPRQQEFSVSNSEQLAPTPIVDEVDTLVLNKWHQSSVNNADRDLVLAIDDKNDKWIKDMTNNMVESIETFHINDALAKTNFYVGTLGVTPTTQASFGLARALMVKASIPMADRKLFLTPDTVAAIIGGQQTFFNPNGEISREYHKGELGGVAGFDEPYENALMGTLANGTRALSAYLCSAYTASTITLSGGTPGQTIAAGEILTTPSSYIMNSAGAQSNRWMGVAASLATFDGSGLAVVTLVNPVVVGTTINATPVGQNVLTLGSASTSYSWCLAMHPKFYTIGTAKLTSPGGAAMETYQQDHQGINFRLWFGGDITSNQFPMRMDALTGGTSHVVRGYVPAVRIACAS